MPLAMVTWGWSESGLATPRLTMARRRPSGAMSGPQLSPFWSGTGVVSFQVMERRETRRSLPAVECHPGALPRTWELWLPSNHAIRK